ncbi:hypothetical protein [Actinophytocola xinjiangensis]|nr:hypothetical protein [Actinophytocola xinjiangensis]
MPRETPRITGPQLTTIMDDAVRVLTDRLPDEVPADITRVVYEVTTELVSTVNDPQRLSTMLRLRATARLSALSGNPVPIRRV